ncbi:MAG: tyrosine-type recombinase/integrase [Sulfuricurvum sp.]|nr:tyrosine-type recombinase/integrase [Sulfuricurvum sp.]
MARQVVPLSDTEIKKAKPKEKDYKLFDGGGLFLLIKPNGGKWWRLKYLIDGKEKSLSLGTYPEVSLLKAREKRDQHKISIAEGINPSTERKEAKASIKVQEDEYLNTFKHCSKDYFELIRTKISEGHYAKQWQRLESNIFPFIGNKNMNDIARDEILLCLTRIQERGAIEEAHRIYNIVSQVYQYAIANRRCERNIASDISTKWTLQPIIRKNFPTITDPKEIGKLLNAIDGYQGEYSVRCALQIMPYVALRPANIREMEWSEIDLDKGILTISATKMKMKREHIVPLVPKVVEILRELYKLTGENRYCFSTMRYKTSPLSNNTLNASLIRLGYSNQEIVPHGFRAMFTTIANEMTPEHGFSSDVIEKCLAHEQGNKVRAAYNRAEYWDQRVGLMQWWGDYLDKSKC